MTTISLIAAMAHDRVIGYNNQMPWHLPADLAHFKKITMNKPIIMGRNTFASIGKALPGRQNIVITSRADYEAPGCDVVSSIDAAIAIAGDVDEIMIIGGGQIYKQCLARAQRMYLTFIDETVPGDAFFPEWETSEWMEVARESHEPDEKNRYAYHFVCLERCEASIQR